MLRNSVVVDLLDLAGDARRGQILWKVTSPSTVLPVARAVDVLGLKY